MLSRFIMALDQGTTSSSAIIFDQQGQIVSTTQKEFTQIYPMAGWVEHDADDIYTVQTTAAREALDAAGLTAKDIAAIGITNQRETTVIWDRTTGKPIHNAIVWQCRRTAPLCDKLRQEGFETVVQSKTGLKLDAYFSATKVQWLLENIMAAKEKAEKGELLFGTIDTWLIWNLTKCGAVHVTDHSNASRTMLYNIHTCSWDEEILAKLGIPACMLPTVRPSSGYTADTDPELFGAAIPIAGAAGDQQAALFGQNCFSAGMAKNTYGTGCFLLMNTGERPVTSKHGLLTTMAASHGGKIQYALEGSVFIGGAVIQWLRDELGLIEDAAESEEFAQSIASTQGVYIVPAFVGLGAPYWDSYARGTITGLTRGAGKAHIIRAALESMAYQTLDIIEVMGLDASTRLTHLQVDGGACANNFLMQFQADILGAEVWRPAVTETTALGAAYLAGLALGFWQNTDDIAANRKVERIFSPQMEPDKRQQLVDGWKMAIRQTLLTH